MFLFCSTALNVHLIHCSSFRPIRYDTLQQVHHAIDLKRGHILYFSTIILISTSVAAGSTEGKYDELPHSMMHVSTVEKSEEENSHYVAAVDSLHFINEFTGTKHR